MAEESGPWEQTVYLATGYKVPTRASVTTDLQGKGNRGGAGEDSAVDMPWISVTISNVGKTNATTVAQNLAGAGLTSVLFFAGTGDGGPMENARNLDLYVVRIGYPWQRGEGVAGTNFNKYSLGVGSALTQLSAAPWKTTGFSFDGLTVPEADAVDLGTFSYRAKSLDRAELFFREHEERLEGWVNAMGRDNAAWQGNAAGVFVNLLDTLRKQYKHYHEQFAPRNFTTSAASVVDGYVSRTFQGNGLILAEQALGKAVKTLKDAHDKWRGDQNGPVAGKAPDGSATTPAAHWNPEAVITDVLNELRQWIDTNNAAKVVTKEAHYGTAYGGANYSYDLLEGFKENVPAYGPLTDPNSWAKVAQEAVARWTNNITANLDPAAETAQTTLSATWSQLLNSDWDPSYGFEEAPPASLTSTSSTSDDTSGSNFDVNDIANMFGNQNASVNSALNDIASSTNDALNGQNDALNDVASSTDDALNDVASSTNDALNDVFSGAGANSDLNGGLDTGSPLPDGVTGDGTGSLTTDSGLGTSPAYTSLLNSALNGGLGTTNTGTTKVDPDGSITVTNPDGSTTTTRPDGTEVTTYPDGSTLTTDPDGLSTLVDADGSTSVQNADGSVTTTYDDGGRSTVDPDGSYTTTSANGQLNQGQLRPGETLTNADGSVTTVDADGSITTTYPDGLVSTLDPDGTYTVDMADGSTIDTSSLNPGDTGTTVSGLNGSSDLSSPSYTSSTSTPNSLLGSGTDSATDGDFLYDDVPYTSSLAGALGGTATTDAGPTSPASVNPGALAAASRTGGLNGEMTAAAERVRSGYADTDSAVTGTSRTGARTAAVADQATARTTTSSGMPFMPMGAGGAPGGQSTQSEDRNRTTWLAEDEEVWGTDVAAAPAVLGRDD
ncbi:AAWKG family protein [Streptomyces sp. NPDC017991]|uniref:AAWKG family protein n=1 Tax=Streptomyces sp. NPDC017991 TaxID=3365026 RepID=UPI0037923500